ncbi:MAG: hypothetical protein SGI88_19035 [Candidatus Hydrogenedentes bacterium]|nr:hypothetical protein [Candidatus Hydrogenedentota bacterium]
MIEPFLCVSDFLWTNWPTWREFLLHGPPMLLWAFVALTFAGWVKRRFEWRTGYTRKIFHFLIFFTVAGLQIFSGIRAVCLFGAMTSCVIAFAILRGAGSLHYEAVAREKDAPYRTHYIIVPYLATLFGGLTSTILFGPFAIVGFLVTGVGDAIGEPVGTRFGKHPYRVPSMRGVVCTRTLEGSAAVFLVSTLAAATAFALLPAVSLSTTTLLIAILVGALSAACEAISPHGWDNFTLQVIPAALAWFVL